MEAEIISVGTELLLGQIANTNAQYLGEQLATLGIGLHHIVMVGDNTNRLKKVLETACQRADVIILTGGLGPTQDDMTKETVAEFFDLELLLDQDCLETLHNQFARRGNRMTDNNLKQAYLPRGGEALLNPNGTAPGVWLEHNDKIVIILPGPPFELKPMFENHVIPRLSTALGDKHTVIKSLIIKTYGIGESAAEELIQDLIVGSNPTLASYAKSTEIQFRLTAKAATEQEADDLISALKEKLHSRLGQYFFAYDEQTMEEVVGDLLTEQNLKLAVAESCTGGLISHWLTNVPGSSNYFLGSIVSYSNEIKQELLKVPADLLKEHGAVSQEVAEAMALGVRQLTQSDIGAAITGIAGPGGATPEKPVGLVFIAISDKKGIYSFRYDWRGARPVIKQRASQALLNAIRQRLLGIN